MKQLFKIFCWDYIKQTLVTYSALVIFSIIVVNIIPFETQVDKISAFYRSFLVTSLIASWILYLMNFPLKGNTNWLLLTPIHKNTLIAFNLLFHLFKIVVSIVEIVILLSIFDFINRWFLLNQLIGTISELLAIFQQSAFNFDLSTYTILVAISILAICSLIFSTGNYFQNWNRYKKTLPSSRIAQHRYLFQKFKYFYFFIGLIVLYALFTRNSFFKSAAFLMPLVTTTFLYLTFYSYNQGLNLFNKKRNQLITLGFLIFFVSLYFGALGYSNSRLASPGVSTHSKLNEIKYQDVFFTKFNRDNFQSYLMIPLSRENIEFLTKKFVSSTPLKLRKVRSILNPRDFNFRRAFSVQKSLSSKLAVLQLTDISSLATSDIDWLIDTFEKTYRKITNSTALQNNPQLSNNSHTLNKLRRQFISIIQGHPFSRKTVERYIESENHLKRKIGIILTGKMKDQKLTFKLLRKVFSLSNESLIQVTSMISRDYCRSLSSALVAWQSNQSPFDNCPVQQK